MVSPNSRLTSACAASKPPSMSGADQRLDRVGQDRRPRRAAAARLALGQLQRVGQAEHERDPVQAVLAHEVGAHAREVALVGAGEAVEQQPRDGQVQHRVAQELEALVVVGAEAAVREGALEQRALGELVAEPLLDQRRPRAGVDGDADTARGPSRRRRSAEPNFIRRKTGLHKIDFLVVGEA